MNPAEHRMSNTGAGKAERGRPRAHRRTRKHICSPQPTLNQASEVQVSRATSGNCWQNSSTSVRIYCRGCSVNWVLRPQISGSVDQLQGRGQPRTRDQKTKTLRNGDEHVGSEESLLPQARPSQSSWESLQKQKPRLASKPSWRVREQQAQWNRSTTNSTTAAPGCSFIHFTLTIFMAFLVNYDDLYFVSDNPGARGTRKEIRIRPGLSKSQGSLPKGATIFPWRCAIGCLVLNFCIKPQVTWYLQGPCRR